MSSEIVTKSVGELVVERPNRSRVFERFHIDYCCGGRLPFGEACARAGVATDDVLAALVESERSSNGEDPSTDWSTATLSQLIDHILAKHHEYLRRELPRLSEMAARVARAHGDRFAWVLECQQVLGELRGELESHMMKEEQMLFPMIRELEAADASPTFHCGNLQKPITVMEHEHDNAGNALSQLRSLSNGFTPPEDACNTLRAWLDGLAELESDLHEHIHEENNILFPRAQQRESQLAGA